MASSASDKNLQQAADLVGQRRPSATQINPGEISRPINLQRIAQRKAQVRTYPKTKKLEKLGVYSSCKVSKLIFKIPETVRLVVLLQCMPLSLNKLSLSVQHLAHCAR